MMKFCNRCKHIGSELPNEGFICMNIEVRMTANDDKAGEYLIDGDETKLAKIRCSTARKFSHLCGKNGRLFEV